MMIKSCGLSRPYRGSQLRYFGGTLIVQESHRGQTDFFLSTRQCLLSLVGLIGSIFLILYILTCCSYSSASLSPLSS